MSTLAKIQLFDIAELPHVRVVTIEGQVDESNLDNVRLSVDPLVDNPNVNYVLLNFSKLTFINSKVIGYLASLYSRMAERHKKMMFVETNEAVMDIITLVGLTKIIPLSPNLQDAVDVVRSDMEQEK